MYCWNTLAALYLESCNSHESFHLAAVVLLRCNLQVIELNWCFEIYPCSLFLCNSRAPHCTQQQLHCSFALNCTMRWTAWDWSLQYICTLHWVYCTLHYTIQGLQKLQSKPWTALQHCIWHHWNFRALPAAVNLISSLHWIMYSAACTTLYFTALNIALHC